MNSCNMNNLCYKPIFRGYKATNLPKIIGINRKCCPDASMRSHEDQPSIHCFIL